MPGSKDDTSGPQCVGEGLDGTHSASHREVWGLAVSHLYAQNNLEARCTAGNGADPGLPEASTS